MIPLSIRRLKRGSSMREADEKTKLNEEMWDSRAKTYDRNFSFTRWTQKKLVSLLEFGRNSHLLDLACGTGWAVRYAASLARGRGKFYGVDLSTKMVQRAEANSASYSNVYFSKSNVERLPFDNCFFDFIISTNAFHHFSSPEKALREAYRVLKPKGRIYILDTTADDFFIRMLDKLAPRFEPAHVKMYSISEYQTLFAKAGLHYLASKRILLFLKTHIAERI
jgi:ubiquinone/menaquinone biosynthesis C-methylase UbiE